MTDETQQPAAEPTVDAIPPAETEHADVAAAAEPTLSAEAAAPNGPLVQVAGDAEKGWLVSVHDGDHAKTYSPVDESGQPHPVAADAVAAALKLHVEEFGALVKAATPDALADLHYRLGALEIDVAHLKGLLDKPAQGNG